MIRTRPHATPAGWVVVAGIISIVVTLFGPAPEAFAQRDRGLDRERIRRIQARQQREFVIQREIRGGPNWSRGYGPYRLSDFQDATAPPHVDELIDTLDAGDFEAREQAIEALVMDRCELDYLLKRLCMGGLSAEQRHRLVTVVYQRLVFEARGAVGIGIDNRFFPERVVVGRLVPDLPAERVLRLGDEITHINGNPLAHWDEFRAIVQTRRPGDVIRLTIIREPEPADLAVGEPVPPVRNDDPPRVRMDVNLELGSTNLLQDNERRGFQDVVRTQRIDRAEQARAQFVVPRPIVVLQNDAPGGDGEGDTRATADHPAIDDLLEWRDRVRQGQVDLDRGLRRDLEAVRQELFDQAHRADLSTEERTYLLAVVTTYSRILREMDNPE